MGRKTTTRKNDPPTMTSLHVIDLPETTNVARKQYSKPGTIPRYGKNLKSPTEIVSRSPSPATLSSPPPLTPIPTYTEARIDDRQLPAQTTPDR